MRGPMVDLQAAQLGRFAAQLARRLGDFDHSVFDA